MEVYEWAPINTFSDKERAYRLMRDTKEQFPQFEFRVVKVPCYVVEMRDNREEKEQGASS